MAQSESSNPDSDSSHSYTFDVVIVGAGIIGLSIARQFLLHSDLSVAIVDASVPCSGATGAGQGYLWMIHKTPGNALWDLSKRSRQLWQILVEDLQDQGIDPLEALGWKKTGSLLVGRTKEESDQLKESVKQLSTAGLRAEYLSRSDLRLKEPELAAGPEGCAAFLSDDGQIDVRKAVAFIEKGNRMFTSQRRYAEFYNDPVVCLLRSNREGKVDAVKTSNYILYAKKAIVVAAGCWTGPLVRELTGECDIVVNVPVQPRKGLLLVLEKFSSLKLNHGVMECGYINYQKTSAETSFPDAVQTHPDQSLSVSMTATLDTEGNLLLGSSRQLVGFNTDMDMNVAEQIWERSKEFFPALRELSQEQLSQRCKVRVGLRPYMPDGKPVIGSIPSMPNVFLATGHEGTGLTLAPGTAEMIVDMVLGNPLKVDPTPFEAEGQCC